MWALLGGARTLLHGDVVTEDAQGESARRLIRAVDAQGEIA